MHFFIISWLDYCDILRSSIWQIDLMGFFSLGVSLHALPYKYGINFEILLTMVEILTKSDFRGNPQIDLLLDINQKTQVNYVGKFTLFLLQFETSTPIK